MALALVLFLASSYLVLAVLAVESLTRASFAPAIIIVLFLIPARQVRAPDSL